MFRTKKERTVEVIVKTKKVASHVIDYPHYNSISLSTGALAVPVRKVVYKRELDEGQQSLLKSAQDFADAQGFGLQVRDISVENMFLRAFRRVASRGKFIPKIMVHGPHEVILPFPSMGTTSLKRVN